MSEQRWLERTDRWVLRLLGLYPEDFREEMGGAVRRGFRLALERTRGASAPRDPLAAHRPVGT